MVCLLFEDHIPLIRRNNSENLASLQKLLFAFLFFKKFCLARFLFCRCLFPFFVICYLFLFMFTFFYIDELNGCFLETLLRK